MITPDGILSSPLVLTVFKVGFIAFSALYFIFSLVIIRQVSLMSETVKTEFGGVLKLVSLVFALLSLSVLVYFLMSL